MKQRHPVVVIATGVMNAGGTESLIMEIFRHKSGRIRYILLVHYDDIIPSGVFDKEISRLGIDVRYINSVGKAGVAGYIKSFKTFADSVGQIDIVHSHLNGSGGVISLAAQRAGIKHRICHCHADIHFTGNWLSRLKNEIALIGMKCLIDIFSTERWACSMAAWKRLYMPWRRKSIIDNMIDTKRYLASEEKRAAAKRHFGLEGTYVVGAVGRVAPIKNYQLILRAIANSKAHFVCFGRYDPNDSYCKSLDEMTRELDVANRVHWMGNSANVTEDIHCIDRFVMPSFTEGFGMAALEAQAAGIPSLLSSGVPQTVDVGIGLTKFLSPHDINAWITLIQEVPTRPAIDEHRILDAFKNKGFNSPDAVKNIENRYLSILRK